MSTKLIDKTAFTDAKQFKHAQDLVVSIKQRHSTVAKESEKLEAEKRELLDLSKEVFFEDISERSDFYQNHDYHTEEGVVHVNFRTLSKKLEVPQAVKDALGDSYSDLFKTTNIYTVTATQDSLLGQAIKSPEMFGVTLKPTLGVVDLTSLVREHPDWVQVVVKDESLADYAKAYPEGVCTKAETKTRNGFIDTIGKLSDTLRKKLRKVFLTILKESLQPVVVCGNTSDKK